MSKIIAPALDICHKFVNDIRRSINSKYFDFYSLTHYVSNCEFSIFISYIPSLFDIDALGFEIYKKAKESDLSTYGWKAHRPLVERRKITLNLHLTTLKKEFLFLFQLFSEKNVLSLVFA